VLYAFDALTLKLLWQSADGELETSGKYNEPATARGTVFVGTDRVVCLRLETLSADSRVCLGMRIERIESRRRREGQAV